MEIKGAINAMCSNHPESIPGPRSMEKLSSVKPVLGATKVEEDYWLIGCRHLLLPVLGLGHLGSGATRGLVRVPLQVAEY